jgi:hypothetical protein
VTGLYRLYQDLKFGLFLGVLGGVLEPVSILLAVLGLLLIALGVGVISLQEGARA